VCAVDVRAIILIGTQAESTSPSSSLESSLGTPASERVVGISIAALDLLGQPIVCHVLDRLRSHGIIGCSVLSCVDDVAGLRERKFRDGVRHVEIPASQIWSAAEEAFVEMAGKTDTVILLRLGPYAEVDFNQLLKFHVSHRNCATSVFSQLGQSLEIIALDSARVQEAAGVLRRKMRWNWRPSETFHSYGYSNLLRDGSDFRRFAEDALMRRCALIPKAREVTTGVWVGKNARIDASARLEGPAFIGERAKIGPSVILSGCSSVEHHGQVDKGTKIDSSTVLPRTYVGRELNLIRSVAGFSRITQVDRDVTVHISDGSLTKPILRRSIKRALHPVHSGLFLVGRTISSRFSRSHISGATPVKASLDASQPASAGKARVQAAAASASRNLKRKDEEF
jgi:hypothetical protein